jgi:hypothetical protein
MRGAALSGGRTALGPNAIDALTTEPVFVLGLGTRPCYSV